MQAARGNTKPPGTNLLSPTIAARSVAGSTVVHIIPRMWGTIKSFCQARSYHPLAVNGSATPSYPPLAIAATKQATPAMAQ